MDAQPMLPVQTIPKSLEYSPAGDDNPPWAIGDWPAITEAFDIKAHEVNDWHGALAGQGRPWLVIRRIFSVTPLWGDGSTPDDMRVWSWADLAATLGVTVEVLKRDLAAAVDYWRKARLSLSANRNAQAMASAAPADPAEPKKVFDELPDFQIHQTFSEEQIAAVLTPFRFHTVKSPSDRLYVANRILELRKQLEDKYKREQVRQLIVMEMSMANYESAIHALKSRLETIQKSADITDKQSAEIQSISKSLTETEKALTLLSTTYQKQADEISGDEMESGEARRVAIGTASHLMEAHRKYYASGDRELIDGMFTAEEIVWLTQPLTIRPAQYRPDIVLRMREAMIPENLWGKDYKPATFAADGKTHREACRRLLKLVQAMADEDAPPEIEGIDDALVSEDMRDEDDPSEMSAALMPADTSPPPASYSSPESHRDEGPCMATT